jgi:hypothetical protein
MLLMFWRLEYLECTRLGEDVVFFFVLNKTTSWW